MRTRPQSMPTTGLIALALLELWWKLADQVFDLLRVVPVTNQDRVAGSDNNQIVDAQKRDSGTLLIENNIVSRIDCGGFAIGGIAVLIFAKIFRARAPTADVVPIEICFDNQNTIGL